MVTLVKHSEKQSAERRHTRGQHHAVLAALERRNALLQILLVCAAVAGVKIGPGAGPVHIRGVIGQRIAVGHRDRALDGAAVLIHLVAHVNSTGSKPQ